MTNSNTYESNEIKLQFTIYKIAFSFIYILFRRRSALVRVPNSVEPQNRAQERTIWLRLEHSVTTDISCVTNGMEK